MKALRIAFCSLVTLVGSAHAAGFALDTQSARGTGMASAVAALKDEPSAAFYNAAGLLGGRGLELALGDTLIAPNVSVTGPSGEAARDTAVAPPPHLYARYQPTDWAAAGLGVFVPFGAQSEWPAGWEGRFRSTGSALSVYVINPEVAFTLLNHVRVGGGLQVSRATVVLQRALSFVDSEGEAKLGGAAWAFGYNLGAQASFDQLDIGVSWRSSVKLDVTGKAHFSNVPTEFASTLKDQEVTTSVVLPDVVYAGLAYRPIEHLQINLDLHYLHWSDFPSLELKFADESLNSTTVKSWHNTVSLHAGGEYQVTKEITARAGLAYDPSPSPVDTLTPDIPDADRLKFALGGGYRWNDFQFDAAYQLVLLSDTRSTSPLFPASYSGTAHVFGVTVGWHAPL